MRTSHNWRRGWDCDRCGGLNHTSPNCRYKDVTCRKCGKVCHIERVYRSAPTQGQTQRGRRFPSRGRSFHPGYGGMGRGRGFGCRNATNQVVFDATAHDSTDYDIYTVDTSPSLHLQRKERQPPIVANVLLNGQPLTVEVDTEAATSLINDI